MIYFAFTSLTTVGFGEFCPRGDVERVIGAMLLLMGVAIFSYIMSMFIEMIEQFQKLNKDLDDDTNLLKFLGTLRRFNNNYNLNDKFKNRIENYFSYKWSNDRNLAFIDEDDK